MTSPSMTRALLVLPLLLVLAACQPAEPAPEADVAAAPAEAAPAATAPMLPTLLVRHKVEDYGVWKEGFDAHGVARGAAGSQGGRLYRNADDPSELVIAVRFETLDQARAFAASDDLRETMAELGVADQPDVYFLDATEDFAQ